MGKSYKDWLFIVSVNINKKYGVINLGWVKVLCLFLY